MKSKIPLLIFVIIVLFSSCATTKYDYYYSTFESNNSNVNKNNREVIKNSSQNYSSGFSLEKSLSKKKDSIVVGIGMDINDRDKSLGIGVASSIPIYVDYQKTKIIINDTLYNIKQYDDTLNNIVRFNSKKRTPLGYVNLSICQLNNIYKKQNNFKKSNYLIKVYDKKDRIVKNEYKKIPKIEFTNENSPVNITLSIVYYTDADYKDMQTLNLILYQSELMRLTNMRDNDKGEQIGIENENVLFFTAIDQGKAWGWPEIRKGLGWTTTAITLPVTVPINLVYVLIDGTEQALIHYPLFE